MFKMQVVVGSFLVLLVRTSLGFAPPLVPRFTHQPSMSSSTILRQSSPSAPMETTASYDYATLNMPVHDQNNDILASYPDTTAAVTTVNSANPLQQFSEGYSRLTKNHYLPMAFVQAGFLASSADVATQLMQASTTSTAAVHVGVLDGGHVAAMALVASTMSGVMNAVWLKQLEQAFPGTSTTAVAAKTMIHAVILASIINSAYLVGVPLFTNMFHADPYAYVAHNIHSLHDVLEGWKWEEFLTLTKLEVMMFIPYNTLAFKFVPPSIRPLTHASISATFNVAVSAITLGIFGTWCDYAMHLFTN
jgi:hypothetical protein